MTIPRPVLPYGLDALEPHVSKRTMSFHYDKHHLGYVDKLNRLIEGTPYEGLSLESIIERARSNGDIDILNNAQQVWNHDFFWKSMAPNAERVPEGRIKTYLEDAYGDLDTFRDKFREAARSLFGSGWVWLVDDKGQPRILTTGNADSPVGTDVTPLLTLDVWEHAYYLDYQNRRGEFVDTFVDHLLNWRFAAANLETAALSDAA